MLDRWLESGSPVPQRWLKITGRYQILNLKDLLHECETDDRAKLIIDQVPRAKMTRTYVFCSTTDFYKKQIKGSYRECDDRKGEWVERVLYRRLAASSSNVVHSFRTQPRISATAGSSGAAFPTGVLQWRLKQLLRRFNRLFDRQYLWYSR